MAGPNRSRGVLRASLATALLLWATSGSALEDADRAGIRGAIEGQISAFRADDSERAYSYASPSIQRMFPSPDGFMAMVRGTYAPVFHPRRYEFGGARDTENGPEQAVRIDDVDGIGWDAVYSFERQVDGTWRISGCRLVKAPDQSV